jgi:leader peptidase (prepilin peptidase)/N-methyltransferase
MLLWSLLGFVVGWLINLASDVWPRYLPILWPPHCLHCNTPRAPMQWVGVLAYLLGQSKCRQCNQRLSWRWPLIEILSVILFTYLYSLFDFSPRLLLTTFYSSILLLICVTDFEHRLILNKVTFPAIACAIVFVFLTPYLEPFNALMGFAFFTPPYLKPFNALLGGISALLIGGAFYWLGAWYVRWRRINVLAFGQGDVTLMIFIGLIVGFVDMIPAFLIGSILAVIVSPIIAILRRQSILHMTFAYGPYWAVGGWIMLLKLASGQ